ncbi:MAG: hypothetical protein V1779_04945 [bacterium]
MKKYLSILFLLFFLISCESPWDINTKRNIILPEPMDSVPLSLISLYVETNGTDEQFVIEKAMLEIDTVSNTPIVWGTITISSAITTNFEFTKIGLFSIDLNINNLSVTGNSLTLNNSSTPDSYVKYKIHRWTNAAYDTTITSDPTKNKTYIAFSQDKDNKELWIYLDAMIFDKRFYYENDSLGNIISIPDSLFIKTRLHFNY